ncbi:MAG: DUF493 domain-containing protein [Flavobacteriales bacterium]
MEDDRLVKLKELLTENFCPPEIYMFKFIVPNNNQAHAMAMALFDESAQVESRVSGKGSYISLTAREMMVSVDSILEKYRAAYAIDGLIAL